MWGLLVFGGEEVVFNQIISPGLPRWGGTQEKLENRSFFEYKYLRPILIYMKNNNIDNFINTKFSPFNMSTFFVRLSIFLSLKRHLPYMRGTLLDVGCGKMPYRDFILKNSQVSLYIGADIEDAIVYDHAIKPDVYWDGKNIPIENESIDFIIATETLEHCPHPEIIFNESFRLLKDGGGVFLTTPFIFPLHESPRDEFRFTPFSLERLAKDAGFRGIEVQALGGEKAVLAQILAINKNKIIKALLLPLIYILVKIDKKPEKLGDNSIFTGLSFFAIK